MSEKAPKQRLVYEGPIGLCPCCNTPTEVRIGSTHGEPALETWIVPRDVLALLYRATAARIKERAGKLYVTDPSTLDTTVRSKFFFVDANDGIAGPFGQLGLKVFLGTSFGQEKIDSIRVYVVSATHRSLSIIRNSPYAREPDSDDDLDGSADLF